MRKAKLAAIAVATVLCAMPFGSSYAQGLQYKVGDHVAAPVGAQFFEAIVTQVIANPPSYRVHPIGFAASDDFTANPQMLRPMGSVKVSPPGNIK